MGCSGLLRGFQGLCTGFSGALHGLFRGFSGAYQGLFRGRILMYIRTYREGNVNLVVCV